MSLGQRKITIGQLLYEVLPRLHSAERLIRNTLASVIEATHDPLERARLQEQRDTLELELFNIRLNVEHLLKRNAESVVAVRASEGRDAGALLSLDDAEAAAIDRAQHLHERVLALRKDRVG